MTIYPASFADEGLLARVGANLADVRRRIMATGRSLASVRIVGVTKMFGLEMVRAASTLGITTLGENYVEELRTKRLAASDLDVRWHYLGALQTNKIARVMQVADVLCGVSRAREIEKIASIRDGAAIYVQVDFTGASARNGAAPAEVAALVRRAQELGLSVQGLMTVAPIDVRAAREAFYVTNALADDLSLVERSMGMSDDLELACECGSSEVRVGRALFGERGPATKPSPNIDPGGTAARRIE